MVRVGQKVQFDPFEYIQSFGSSDHRGGIAVGTVVLVNYENQWFSVEYGEKPTLRTSFKFCDIGQVVTILG